MRAIAYPAREFLGTGNETPFSFANLMHLLSVFWKMLKAMAISLRIIPAAIQPQDFLVIGHR